MHIKSKLRKSLFFSKGFYKSPVVFPLWFNINFNDFEKKKKNIIYSKQTKREPFSRYRATTSSENTRIKSVIYRKKNVFKKNEKYIGIGESEIDVSEIYTPDVKCKIVFNNVFERIKGDDFLHFILYSYLKENVKDLNNMFINNYNIYNKISKHVKNFENIVLKNSDINGVFINEEIINIIKNKKYELNILEMIPYYNWLIMENLNYLLRFDENDNMFMSYNKDGYGYSIELKIKDKVFIKDIKIKNQRQRKEAPREIRVDNPLLDALKNNMQQSFNLTRRIDGSINCSVSIPNWLVHDVYLKRDDGKTRISSLGRNDFAYFEWINGELKINLKKISEQKDPFSGEVEKVLEIISRCDNTVSDKEAISFLYTYIYKKKDMEDMLHSFVYEKTVIEKDHLFSMLPLTSIFYERVMNEIIQLETIIKKIDKTNNIEEIIKLIV